MYRNFLFLFLLAALATTPGATAAALTVPGSHATLTAALDAATTGDSITITNSANHTDALHITKPVTIKAAVGQTPKLVGNATTDYVIRLTTGSQGTKIGDLAGGRITIGNDTFVNTTNPMRDLLIQHTTGTVTIENISFYSTRRNYHTANTSVPSGYMARDRQMFVYVGGTTTTQVLGAFNLFNCSVQNASHGLWLANLNNTGTTNRIEDCTFNPVNFAAITKGAGNLIFRRNFMTNASNWAPLYYDSSTAGANVIDSCISRPTGNAPGFSSASRGNHQTLITNSAFILPSTGTQQVIPFASTSLNGEWYIFDHCDFFSSSTAPTFRFDQPTSLPAPNASQIYPGNRGLEVYNSNIVQLGTGGIVGVNTAASQVKPIYKERILRFANNNIYAPRAAKLFVANPATDGFTTYSVQGPVRTLEPTWTSRTAGNLTYTDVGLVRAGEERSPMGSCFNFVTMTEGVIPPSRARHFTAFE